MKPVIGMPQPGNDLFRQYMKSKYVQSIHRAGGEARWIELDDLDRAVQELQKCDGLLLTGGGDVDPKYYMEDRHPKCGEPNPERDSFELSLLTSVMLRDKPVLGICRGIQLLNVGLGGSLYQHVEGHADTNCPVWHDVYVREGTLLHDIVGKTQIHVNSWHHQMVKGTGKSVKVCADLEDGRTEAIWIPGRKFFLGVQWHPEMYYTEDEDAAKIFRAFAGALGK